MNEVSNENEYAAKPPRGSYVRKLEFYTRIVVVTVVAAIACVIIAAVMISSKNDLESGTQIFRSETNSEISSLHAEVSREAELLQETISNLFELCANGHKVCVKQLGNTILGDEVDEASGTSNALSADGRIVAIGSPEYGDKGRVRVFSFNETLNTWELLGNVITGELSDRIGLRVSLSSDGQKIAIGSLDTSTDGAYVVVYAFNGVVWEKLGSEITNPTVNDNSFGQTLYMSSDGSRVAVAAVNGLENGEDRGWVEVYEYNNVDWVLLGNRIEPGEAEGDNCGFTLSFSDDGETVAIGCRHFDLLATGHGAVFVYKFDGVSWIEDSMFEGEDTSDGVGSQLGLSRNGGVLAFNNNQGQSGSLVEIFTDQSGSWTSIGTLFEKDRCFADYSLNFDGTRLAAAVLTDEGSGACNDYESIRIYDYDASTGTWSVAANDIPAPDFDAVFPVLSADGSTLIVGFKDGHDTGRVDGTGVGIVTVYHLLEL